MNIKKVNERKEVKDRKRGRNQEKGGFCKLLTITHETSPLRNSLTSQGVYSTRQNSQESDHCLETRFL